jgi:myo-inositol 2-dehydrogenase / D-chiro-inositol 1-dehydrogenase
MTIRVALIGTGMMAAEHIANLALYRSRVTLCGFADPEASSLDLARFVTDHNWGAGEGAKVQVFADHRDLLRDAWPDAVIVSSPNFTHAAILDDVMAAGVAILCEKPLATTLADAMRLARAAETYAPLFWIGMEYRFMPPVAAFVARVHGGATGRLRMLSIREHRFPFLKKVGDWNRFARNTGGTMVEKCCHFFDLMRHIIRSEPVRVYCSGAMDVNHLDERYGEERPDIIDNSFTTVDFADGTRALLDLCMFAEGAEEQEEMSATGDAARLDVTIPSGVLVTSPRMPSVQPKRVTREPIAVDAAALKAGTHHGATYYQLGAFLDALETGKAPAVSAEDGYRAAAMGLAAEISAREHRAVAMAELGL